MSRDSSRSRDADTNERSVNRDANRDANRDSNKERALSAALAQIERQFGKGSMMRLGDREQVSVPAISTGSLGLDVALGVGGLPRGRVVEIYGPESSGKTTLTLQVIAEAQTQRRHLCLHRCRARARPHLRSVAGCRHRRPADFSA